MIALLFVLSCILLLLPFLPISEERQKKCVAQLEYARCYALEVDGKPIFYLNELGKGRMETSIHSSIDSVHWYREPVKGCWTNRFLFLAICRGRLTTTDPDYGMKEKLAFYNEHLDTIIPHNIKRLEEECKHLKKITQELDYYLDVNNVTDEGYNTIASFATRLVAERQQRERALALLKQIKPTQRVELKMIQQFTLLEKNDSGKTVTTDCRILENETPSQLLSLQTERHYKPKDSKAIFHNILTENLIDSITKAPIRHFPSEVYEGEKKDGKREGHGRYYHVNGIYYDGMWANDMREGFGFAIDSIGRLRVGEWKEDRYLGERMTYSHDRIFGIDISRYQHDIGKKHYAINWSKVRITHLGTISNKRINGTVDYPVSFCFIKSTEGTTIRNKYFLSDYTNAKRQGIPCGAYHFFSTTSSGSDQAHYFLKNTRISKGDLPPVLDIEPSAGKIHAMGGVEVMWDRIRVWLRIVEKEVGVKPILYVSQNFVNKYMNEVPDIKRDYQVWIARYGEYKPDIRLVMWQLCPDGRVSGITGDVDINIFNGYRDQFDDFLNEASVR